MKRIIAFAMLLCLIFCFFSCDILEGSSSSSSSSEESSSKESSVDTSSSEEESSSESESSEQESSSEEESSSESTSSEESSSSEEESSEEVVVITEYNGFSSAITSVGSSTDRLRQMSMSRNAYNKGSSYSDSQISSILSNAKLVKTGGELLGYKNASGFIDHFLGGTGENYEIDMSKFLSDQNANTNKVSSLTNALRACEKLAVKDEKINVFQKTEIVHHNLTGDWKFAVGSYFSSIEVKDLTFNGEKYSATFIYKVTDYYNWDSDDSSSVFSGFAGTITGNISPKDLHQLHRTGNAKEFLSVGQVSYTVEWTVGASVLDVFK